MNSSQITLCLTLIFYAGNLSGCCHESEIPGAARGLQSAEARERNRSLQVLARCGSKADIDSLVPRIAALMYDKNVGVASSAAYALRRIDSKEAREALRVAEDARARRSSGTSYSTH